MRAAAGSRELVYSAAQTVIVGKDDATVARRAKAAGHEADDLRSLGAPVGSPAEVVDRLSQFGEAGASRIYLQLVDMTDLDHLELIASEVRPQLS